jgi:hypothetical protein
MTATAPDSRLAVVNRRSRRPLASPLIGPALPRRRHPNRLPIARAQGDPGLHDATEFTVTPSGDVHIYRARDTSEVAQALAAFDPRLQLCLQSWDDLFREDEPLEVERDSAGDEGTTG